ncbi:hypothetical protein GCM10027446_06490 [Angustibacter peucedani]
MTTTEHLDGNALAGPFSELFAVDVTLAVTTCVGCGRVSRVAELQVYLAGPGAVARCPGCQDTVARYVRTPTEGHLDLRGTLSLTVPLGPQG